jgi:predicted acylesterase/phospholipase RssA
MTASEFDRNAVITIQGGGLHALNLLGQLAAVTDAKLVPLALAGTSAGAIVATLLWARFTPEVAFGKIVALANPSLAGLLGPFEQPPRSGFTFVELRALLERGRLWAQDLRSSAERKRSLWQSCCALFSMPIQLWRFSRLRAVVVPHLARRGFFAGDELERQIDTILRSAPDFQKYRSELTDLRDWPDPVRFRHFRQLAEAHPDECYRPPLFLTVTNLTSRRLELLNSVDHTSEAFSVAAAVRASAGFPLFFAPTQALEGGWYVDGGVVSNFPAWIFSHEFRRRMQAVPRFRGLSMRPWVHVGLRVVDDPTPLEDLSEPFKYLSALGAMLRGQARNELEDLLAQRVPRSKLISQPVSTCEAPPRILDFDQVDVTRAKNMYEAGRTFAKSALASLSFTMPGGQEALQIISELQRLVDSARRIFSRRPLTDFRANVFLPFQDQLVLTYAYNMDGDSDEHMVFSATAGLTGACFTTRCPLICNLEKVRALAKAGTIVAAQLFNMTPAEQGKVDRTRTWLASTPIFDLFDSRPTPRPSAEDLQRFGFHYYQLNSLMDGAVLGVLSLDTDLEYATEGLPPDPEIHYRDERVQDVLDLMQGTSLRVGHLLGSAFGASV